MGTVSQSQAEGEPEGHLNGNLCHRIVETHVEFLRDGLQQHPPERQQTLNEAGTPDSPHYEPVEPPAGQN